MTIFPTSEKKNDPEKISSGTLAYVCARNRNHLFDLIADAFQQTGWTQAHFATVVGMSREVISRILKRPRNLRIDTASKLYYGLTGNALLFVPEMRRSEAVRHERLFADTFNASDINFSQLDRIEFEDMSWSDQFESGNANFVRFRPPPELPTETYRAPRGTNDNTRLNLERQTN